MNAEGKCMIARPCISITQTNEASSVCGEASSVIYRLCVQHWGQNGRLGFIERVLKVSWVLSPDGKQGWTFGEV